MKVGAIEIYVTAGDGAHAGLADKAKPLSTEELVRAEIAYRKTMTEHLKSAEQQKQSEAELNVFDERYPGFPLGGQARIVAQVVMKAAKNSASPLKKITFCLPDDTAKDFFHKTFDGHIRHKQEELGLEPFVTVDIIIELPEGVILIERSNPPYGWALPGGFLDPGESLETAAAREAKEETNMDLDDLRQFHTYSDPKRDARFHTISTVFVGKGVGTPQNGDDARDLKVVAYDKLLDLDYAFDHKQVIADYLKRRSKKG